MDTITWIQENLLAYLYSSEQVDTIYSDCDSLQSLIDHDELSLALNKAQKSSNHQDEGIKKILDELDSPLFIKGLSALYAESGIELFSEQYLSSLLFTIQTQLDMLSEVKITMATELHPHDLKEMAAMLSKRFGKQVVFKIQIKHGLIGGAVVQYGNYIHDYSLKTALDEFKTRWKKAAL